MSSNQVIIAYKGFDKLLEREAFEAWAGRDFYNNLACVRETWNEATGRYFDAAHQMAWKAWQARAVLTATPAPAEPVAWFKHGPYEDGEPLSVVFENPHDDECYSALVFAEQHNIKEQP